MGLIFVSCISYAIMTTRTSDAIVSRCLKCIIAFTSQVNPVVGDLEHNRDKILSCIEDAKSDLADIVVFPELTVCGYPPEDLLLKPHFVKDNIRAVKGIVKATSGITAIVGFADRDGEGNIYNAAAVMADKKMAGVIIAAEDVGGNISRTLFLDVGTGRTWLQSRGHEWDL